MEIKLIKYFNERVYKTKACWIWTGSFMYKCYGEAYIKGEKIRAHRLSWLIHNGEIPNGLFVCHKCDTPQCVNPDHLFLGAAKSNMLDCVSKGRNFQQKKMHCPQGHEYSKNNIIRAKDGSRICRKCRDLRNRKKK